jgi:hypothetical protein
VEKPGDGCESAGATPRCERRFHGMGDLTGIRFERLGTHTLHLCVDMQNVFAERTDWHLPWMHRGLHAVLATDALCSTPDQAHEHLLALYRDRFSQQIEAAEVAKILDCWR